MVYCNYCRCETDVEIDDAKGISCCVGCGRVLEDIAFSADVTFQKDAAGESTVAGQFVNESGVARGIGRIHGGRVYAFQADSHERAQLRGRQDISFLVDHLKIRHREESIESAHRLYKLALQRGFTRGRRTNQVAAACLYLVCRQDNKPFLLIDFSDALQISVFTLGAVFLQLAKLLRLEEHPLFVKPVDPSLYIHRFADKMNFPNRMALEEVAETAVRLVASMKRDWIQTGRRPSGVCGAALYIAAHMHGYERTKKSIVGIVHIGEHTLAKRLTEFSSTEAASLKKQEFKEKIDAIQSNERAEIEADPGVCAPADMIAGCEHVLHGEDHFRHGMCRVCYMDFVVKTGGMHDGANPPAFSKNRATEAKKSAAALALTAASPPLALPAPGIDNEQGDDGVVMDENGGHAAVPNTNANASASPPPAAADPAVADAAVAGAAGADAAPSRTGRTDETARSNTRASSRRRLNLTVELIQAAEAEVTGFDQAIAEAEAEDAHRRRRGPKGFLSDKTILAMANNIAVQEAVRSMSNKKNSATLGGESDAGDAEENGNEEPMDDVSVAGALVPISNGDTSILPLTIAMGNGAVQEDQQAEEDEGEEDKETLSDVEDEDIEMYLADEEEVKCKEEIWNMMNQDWVEKQLAKRQALEAAERAQAEQRAAMEAAAAAGVQYKRGRGRPLGSKSKPKPEQSLPPAETPQEAAMRMLHSKKLSSKINYSVLADLFSDDNAAEGGEEGRREGEENENDVSVEKRRDSINGNCDNGEESRMVEDARPAKQQKTRQAAGTTRSNAGGKAVSRIHSFQPRLGSLKSKERTPTAAATAGGGGAGGVPARGRLGGLQGAITVREGLRSHAGGSLGKDSEKKSALAGPKKGIKGGGSSTKKVQFSQGTKKK